MRDKQGKLLPGHPGLKKKGDVHAIAGDIKTKVADFLNSRADELEGIWKELKPRDKAQMFADLVPYIVPKQKEIALEVSHDVEEITRIEICRNFDKLFPDMDAATNAPESGVIVTEYDVNRVVVND